MYARNVHPQALATVPRLCLWCDYAACLAIEIQKRKDLRTVNRGDFGHSAEKMFLRVDSFTDLNVFPIFLHVMRLYIAEQYQSQLFIHVHSYC